MAQQEVYGNITPPWSSEIGTIQPVQKGRPPIDRVAHGQQGHRSPYCGDGFLKPVATSCYQRVKNRNGARPDATDDTFYLTLTCLCLRNHEPIRTDSFLTNPHTHQQPHRLVLIKVDLDVDGMPKGDIIGNQLCWFGNLFYLTRDLTDPNQKLLQRYNKRAKKFGKTNISDKVAKKALHDWCIICGVKAETVNNTWARKTFINTALHELLLPEQVVMNVSGHRSAIQMRLDYCVAL